MFFAFILAQKRLIILSPTLDVAKLATSLKCLASVTFGRRMTKTDEIFSLKE